MHHDRSFVTSKLSSYMDICFESSVAVGISMMMLGISILSGQGIHIRDTLSCLKHLVWWKSFYRSGCSLLNYKTLAFDSKYIVGVGDTIFLYTFTLSSLEKRNKSNLSRALHDAIQQHIGRETVEQGGKWCADRGGSFKARGRMERNHLKVYNNDSLPAYHWSVRNSSRLFAAVYFFLTFGYDTLDERKSGVSIPSSQQPRFRPTIWEQLLTRSSMRPDDARMQCNLRYYARIRLTYSVK